MSGVARARTSVQAWARFGKPSSTAVSSPQVSRGSTLRSLRSSCVGMSECSAVLRPHRRLTRRRAFFVDVLSSYLTSTKFTRYELTELVGPTCEAETSAALSNPATHAVELAHALAFRNGLGNSIFATPGHHLTADDVRAYAQSVFGSGNVAVLGTGIDPAALEKLLEKSLGKFAAAASPASSTSKYFGGETRVDAHGAPETVFIGFGTSGAPSAELAVLAAHLDPTPSVKWSKSTSPIAAGIPEGSSVQAVYLPYSDASLFGLLVQGSTTAAVKEAGKAAVAALQAAGNLKGEELQKAISKAKFTAASAVDGRDGLISSLGPKVSALVKIVCDITQCALAPVQILSGTSASLSEAVSSLEKVDASAFSKVSSLQEPCSVPGSHCAFCRRLRRSSRPSRPSSPSAMSSLSHTRTSLGFDVAKIEYTLLQ